MPLTPEAKSRLSSVVRSLRAEVLRDLRAHVEAVYRLAVPADQARLGEAEAVRRRRLEAWLDERARGTGATTPAALKAARGRFLGEAVHEAAATLLNRLVYLRLLEHTSGPDGRPLRRLKLVTGGWSSEAMAEFRDYAGPLLETEGEGYDVLLRLVFDDLAIDLPGLYGPVGVTPLIPIPVALLRRVVTALDDPALTSAWDDDTTFGWVYQYWNDPAREALDAKIADGGKIEPHEIASKTQMFTERYMVEWLLQNSLGPTWLAMCRKNGWTPDAERILPGLEARRAEWRARREAGEVPLDALMPIAEGLEDRWKYYVPQDIPEEAVAAAPATLRELKLLDPACGSGHFLVIACDLLFALYKEEARHRGEAWTDRQIVEWIVADNLHGIDIDPRAVQIAAAALLLKARSLAPDCRPPALNLVAPAFDLAGLPDNDPALVALLTEVERDTGLPASLTRDIVRALSGAGHLGTLLKVENTIRDAVLAHEVATGDRAPTLDAWARGEVRDLRPEDIERLLAERLESFLARHSDPADLGLRLDGEQLAAGVRFMRLVRPGTYHVVVGNPPYQNTNKMAEVSYIEREYVSGKTDVYTAFIERAIHLSKDSCYSALVTMRGWLWFTQYRLLRNMVFSAHNVRAVVDLGAGAFEEIGGAVVNASMHSVLKGGGSGICTAVDATRVSFGEASRAAAKRKILQEMPDVYRPDVRQFYVVQHSPFLYRWTAADFDLYRQYPAVGERLTVRAGISTQDNTRYLRKPHEVAPLAVALQGFDASKPWAPFIKGGAGRAWFEPVSDLILWDANGVQLKVFAQTKFGSESKVIPSQEFYFRRGVAFTVIGDEFRARVHRAKSIFGNKGASVFPEELNDVAVLFNSSKAAGVLSSLNPGIGFEVGDVNRLPLFPIEGADEIYAVLDAAFTEHEAARETSVEFRRPGPSAWGAAQDWAQRAVDRPAGEPLPPYEPVYEDAAPVAWVSYAFGQAMGRFGRDGEGILDAPPADALPDGILFLSGVAGARDGLDHPACAALLAAWEEHGGAIKRRAELRDWLRADFFKDHKKTYENRPIWLPLSSARKTFVAWVALHRFGPGTLDALRAHWLLPEKARLDGLIADLRRSAAEAAGAAARAEAEKGWADLAAALDELAAFERDVDRLSQEGPWPTGPKCPKAEVAAPLVLDLDDGVMINAAGLWPLLAPQWKDPAKWWEELASAQGRKDYSWSKLRARYWPMDVDEKCRKDPSLAVAHGCFWRYHPARAYAWELRLQDEIRPDFTINEEGSDTAREAFLHDHPQTAEEIREKERRRREKKAAKEEG